MDHQQHLHWIDLETNKTIQLTQPIWGINDQQVRLFKDHTNKN